MRNCQKVALLSAGLGLVSVAWATGGEGLKVPEGDLTWARWQARLSLGASAPAWRANLKDTEPTGLRVGAVSVSGDYYFTDASLDRGRLGGLRATSGLIVGPRAQATMGQPALGARGSVFSAERRLLSAPSSSDNAPDLASIPYFGLGYTGLSLRGQWSISADLGVVALYPGHAVRLGRGASGSRSFDDVMRDLRWAPVLQMGVSYAF